MTLKEEKMLKYVQIRSSYALKRIGTLSNEEKALIDYDSFCLELMQEIEQLKEEIKKINSIIDKQDRDIVTLSKGNKQLKERINKAIEYIRSNYIEVLKYHDIPSETTSYEIVTVDLLKILKEVE